MESNQLNSPKVFSHKGQGKSTHFQAQMKRVFAGIYSIETGILRANFCRYVAEWEKEKCICIARKGICPNDSEQAKDIRKQLDKTFYHSQSTNYKKIQKNIKKYLHRVNLLLYLCSRKFNNYKNEHFTKFLLGDSRQLQKLQNPYHSPRFRFRIWKRVLVYPRWRLSPV